MAYCPVLRKRPGWPRGHEYLFYLAIQSYFGALQRQETSFLSISCYSDRLPPFPVVGHNQRCGWAGSVPERPLRGIVEAIGLSRVDDGLRYAAPSPAVLHDNRRSTSYIGLRLGQQAFFHWLFCAIEGCFAPSKPYVQRPRSLLRNKTVEIWAALCLSCHKTQDSISSHKSGCIVTVFLTLSSS